MRRFATLLALAFLAGTVLSAPASAQLGIGGHDETSENMTAAFPVATPPNPAPGVVGPVMGGLHLLISEVAVTPTAGEFIEICNPTPQTVALDQVYLSDDWYALTPTGYYKLPTAGYTVTTTTDFTMRFPSGSVILPGQHLVVAMYGTGFFATYALRANFEVYGDDPLTPDMVNAGNNVPSVNGLLTNGGEIAVLLHWDGTSDLVCDIDYVCWGSPGSNGPVVKTGFSVDGPDADAIASPFLPDTPAANQLLAAAPAAGSSIARTECYELQEASPGNGCILKPVPTDGATWGQLKAIYR